MSAQPPKPRQPKGDALDWDDAEIEQEAHVSERDVSAAMRWWKRFALPEDKDLLEKMAKDRKS